VGGAPVAQPVGVALDTPLPQGNADDGKNLFTAQGCSACHSLKPDEKIVGPSLAGVATRAGDRIKAADYKGQANRAKRISASPSYRPVPTSCPPTLMA